MAIISRFAGMIDAWQFAYGINQSAPAPLQVLNGSTTSGTYTLTCQNQSTPGANGVVITPATTTPITVGVGTNSETVTPSGVSTDNLGNVLITATFANAHGAGEVVRSGSVGLQEALNFASATYKGGIVILSPEWFLNGGTTTIQASATIPSGVAIQNTSSGAAIQSAVIPLTLAQILAAFTTPIVVVPAPGAGNLVDVLDATLNLVYGSAAYSGGGAAQLSYGTGVTYPATATWAAADFTGLSANSIVKVSGADAYVGSTNYLNKAVNYTNATAVFTGGTGGSGLLIVNYRIVSGLS